MSGFVTLVFSLSALAFGPATTAPASRPADLRPLLGQHVRLEGTYQSGKLGYLVDAGGVGVYLKGSVDADRREIPHGTIVAVEGVLEYLEYPPTTQPAGAQPHARPPDHFFIRDPKLRVLRYTRSKA